MPLYGDVDHIHKMLRAAPTWDNGEDITDRLLEIQAAVSLALEDECGRTWGVPATDTSRLQWVGAYGMLVLDIPARTITSITTGGTMSGSTMTGGDVTLAADLVNRIVSNRNGLIYAISPGVSNVWPSHSAYNILPYRYPVVVTGDFADSDDDATVPADVTYAANYLILNQFRHENAGPAGFSGPDGATIPIRDPWKDQQVVRVIDKYRLSTRWSVV